jgi:hypothetical protein
VLQIQEKLAHRILDGLLREKRGGGGDVAERLLRRRVRARHRLLRRVHGAVEK